MTATDHRAPARRPEGSPRRPGGRGPWWLVALLAAAVVGLLVALVVSDDDETTTAPPSSETIPDATDSTEPTTATSEEPAVDRSTAVWPTEGSGVAFTDPVDAARSFAEDFLGFQAPLVGDLMQGDTRSGEVEVRPSASGPITTVLVRQLSGEDTWSVLGAATELIDLTVPSAGDVVSSPLVLQGRAHAFEGTVQVSIRADGRADPIGEGFVTGGGDEMRPFEGQVEFTAPTSDWGALVLFTTSAEDGRVWSASVLRIGF